MDTFEKLWALRNFGYVQRFHSERMINDRPSIFHHSASVGIILIELLGENLSVNLLKAALLHDIEEGVTGDIPAPVKWRLSLRSGELAILESEVRGYYDIKFPDLTETEKRYLEAADFLDGVMTCLEQRILGNHFIDRCFSNYEAFANSSKVTSVCLIASELWTAIHEAYHSEQYGSLREEKNFWREPLRHLDFGK